MKTTLSICFIVMLNLLHAIFCYAQDEDFVLKVGYFDFPGLTYTDENGRHAGFVNEITMKTLENTDIKYSIERYPAARFYDYLANGKIHFFNGLSEIASVKASCVSSQIPLFPLEMRIYRLRDQTPVKAKEELAGHSVILVRGFTYKDWGAWIRDEKNKVIFYETDSHEAGFEMLQRGRAEYLLNYRYIDEEVLNRIEIPDLVIEPLFRWYCYFNINKDVPHAGILLKKLEQSYEELLKEGKLRKYE